MKKKRFTEEKIIRVLKESETGARTPELCRRHGISEVTFYNWKSKYGDMTVSEARRLKWLLAELDKATFKGCCRESGRPTGPSRGGGRAAPGAWLRHHPGLWAGRYLSIAVWLPEPPTVPRGAGGADPLVGGAEAPLRLPADPCAATP
jgi:putative transposase